MNLRQFVEWLEKQKEHDDVEWHHEQYLDKLINRFENEFDVADVYCICGTSWNLMEFAGKMRCQTCIDEIGDSYVA